MPRGDGTGPMEYGPKTGRGAGYCAGYVAPGYTNGGFRFGMGSGRGFGRMNCAGYGYPMNVPYQGWGCGCFLGLITQPIQGCFCTPMGSSPPVTS